MCKPFFFLKGELKFYSKNCEKNEDFYKTLGNLGILKKVVGYLEIFGRIRG